MHGILCMSVVKSTNTVAVRNFQAPGIQTAQANNGGEFKALSYTYSL